MAAHLFKKYPNGIVAEPDDPISSQGWTIGCGSIPFKKSEAETTTVSKKKPDGETVPSEAEDGEPRLRLLIFDGSVVATEAERRWLKKIVWEPPPAEFSNSGWARKRSPLVRENGASLVLNRHIPEICGIKSGIKKRLPSLEAA